MGHAAARNTVRSCGIVLVVVIFGMVGHVVSLRSRCIACLLRGDRLCRHATASGKQASPWHGQRSDNHGYASTPTPILGLPWTFCAGSELQVSLNLGDEQVAFYHARQPIVDRPVTGMALYNVTPEKVGKILP